MATIAHHLREARRRLEAAGLDTGDAAFDADLLARHALGGVDRGQLIARQRDEAPPGFAAAFDLLVARRAAREPAAYILGRREFWHLDFEVTPDTLIPRPDTELIVEETLSRCPSGVTRLADVCTGSGCLAVSLARALPRARIVATDLSAAALAVAARNAATHGVTDRLTFTQADLLEGIDGPFDVVVSNPPYVASADVDAAQPEVRDYEPRLALDGGVDGLDLVRRLVPQVAARLTPGGWCLIEFGFGQADGVRAVIAAEPRLVLDTIRHDYAGIPRTAIARRAESPAPRGARS
jgi:release factor glutamine methyltransferase